MRAVVLLLTVALSAGVIAQESTKPVPKDSVRLFIPGCSKGYVFTAGPRTADQPGSSNLPEGTHLRMAGPKKIIDDIKRHEGSMIEIAGLVKRGDLVQDGISIGGIRIRPGTSAGPGLPSPATRQIVIDVESWRSIAGDCRR